MVVVGAGTAGANAALQLARQGRRVALLDVRPFSAAGARWVNGVPLWQYERAGLELPTSPETRGPARPVLLTPDGKRRLTLGELPVAKADMRHLVARLHRLAAEAGVEAFERTRLREVVLEGERPVAIRATRHSSGRSGGQEETLELRAKLFVDGSGLGAALRSQVPALASDTPTPGPEDLCVARQEVREIELEGARAYLEEHGIGNDQSLTFLGVAGGFSTLLVNVDLEAGEVELLGGSLVADPTPCGKGVIEGFRAQHPWVGARKFGGQGKIPIRRPYDRFAAEGIALVGNAACQVFPAHGSGIGAGMMGARILAEAVEGREDPGSQEALWAYQARLMRELGGLLTAFDVFRRMSQELSNEQIGRMIDTGLMTPHGATAGLLQHMPQPGVMESLRMLRGALQAPRLASSMIPSVARMQRVKRAYARYPERPSREELRRWAQRAAKAHGGRADLQ